MIFSPNLYWVFILLVELFVVFCCTGTQTIEVPSRYHDLGNKRQHPFGNKGGVGSGEARQEFNKWRKEYWKARYANEMIKRGIIE